MAYPTDIGTAHTTNVDNVDIIYAADVNDLQTEVTALKTKVGIDSSAVTTTHDHKLGEVTGADKAVGKTATQELTNKTLTSPVINVGSDATGDIYYRNAGILTRLVAGANNTILKIAAGIPSWAAETVTVNGSTTVAGIYEAGTSAEITAGTATGATGAVLVVTPDALLASRPVTDVQVFSTAGTANWTKGANAKWVEVTVIGGGGAGGSGTSGANSSGGGGGSYGFKRFNAAVLGATESYTVGAGGVAGANNSAGGAGGNSSFGTTLLLRANGGPGGGATAAAGGVIGNGDVRYAGGASALNGAAGVDTATDPSPRGGGSGGYNTGSPATAIAGGNGGAFITNYAKAGGAGGAVGVNAGAAAPSTDTGLVYGGVGGGGGGYNGNGTNTGGNGGAGNLGSGGGGSSGTNNTAGNGGVGLVVIVTYF